MTGSARLILAAPKTRGHTTLLLVLVLILPLLAPFSETQAAQIEAEDFGIIQELHEVLAERDTMLDSKLIRGQAQNALAPVQQGVRSLSSNAPLSHVDEAMNGLTTQSWTGGHLLGHASQSHRLHHLGTISGPKQWPFP